MMMIRRKSRRKTAKTKTQFRGEEFLGPQASLRVTPCPQAPNHTRGEVIRPPSQIENNSYSVIRTHDLDDLSCTRCAPTIAARPSRIEPFFLIVMLLSHQFSNLLPIMPVWHIGQQRNPSNPAYL